MNWLPFKILSAPRETMRLIDKPNSNLVFFSFIVGFVFLLNFYTEYMLAGLLSNPVLISMSIVLAIPVGYCVLSVVAFFTFITGKIFKGKASFLEIRSALAYTSMPLVINVLVWVVQLVTYYPILFSDQFIALYNFQKISLIMALTFVQFGILIYSFILLLHALGEVQGFSAWIALLNMIVQSLLLRFCLSLVTRLLFYKKVVAQSSSVLNYLGCGEVL